MQQELQAPLRPSYFSPGTGNPEQTDSWMGQAEWQATVPSQLLLLFRPQLLESSSQAPDSCLASMGLLEFGPGLLQCCLPAPSERCPKPATGDGRVSASSGKGQLLL